MSDGPERLIVFTRYPEPGTTKTRLIPVLGPEGAAELQRRMTLQVAQAAEELRKDRPLTVEIRFEGGSCERMQQWLGAGFAYRPQGEGDIGRRMSRALAQAFAEGCRRAVLVGSDIPGISSALMAEAFDRLRPHDLVFGPAADGGYYLIGGNAACFRRGAPFLDAGIDWGTAGVLEQTLGSLRAMGLRHALLARLTDIDRPGDLAEGMQALSQGPGRCALSVIIPALNEAGEIGGTVSALSKTAAAEIVVVDGGSRDATVAIAAAAGARILRSPPPRAVQMNAGAAAARGDILIFLHADTRLPDDFAHQVTSTLAAPGVCAGAFHLHIDATTHGLRLIERAANWRAHFLQLPYGDQALFMPMGTFWELAGFRPLAIMEDFEMLRRLRRRGRVALAPGVAATSARRWQQQGILKTWLLNQWLIAAYHLGVSTDRLARWYRLNK
ncbi:MAG TPA: TIGR04283 family arsenosugar biosynthesis glycosyltransferase [Desulfobacterales bacterium]|nr:TIGR04283 family arsenosugar biosynthesis glycosyltransferase [Desulfobacterales bacterium]